MLKGSEKQVAWAEEIMARYQKTADTLREVLDIYSDTTQVEVIEHDPIFGDEVRLEYVKNITPDHQAAITTASHWQPGPQDCKATWTLNREEELLAAGHPHAGRQSLYEFIAATLAELGKSLLTEDDARYWIDRR